MRLGASNCDILEMDRRSSLDVADVVEFEAIKQHLRLTLEVCEQGWRTRPSPALLGFFESIPTIKPIRSSMKISYTLPMWGPPSGAARDPHRFTLDEVTVESFMHSAETRLNQDAATIYHLVEFLDVLRATHPVDAWVLRRRLRWLMKMASNRGYDWDHPWRKQ